MQNLFILVAEEQYEGDIILGIYTSEEAARNRRDIEAARPYGEQSFYAGCNVCCYECPPNVDYRENSKQIW